MKIRRFQCNTHVVLPAGLTPIDGQPNMRFEPGQTFDVDDSKCQTMQRYVLGRLRAKDLTEVDYVPTPGPAAAAVLAEEPAPTATPVVTPADHVPITASSPPPKADDPAFTFTTKPVAFTFTTKPVKEG